MPERLIHLYTYRGDLVLDRSWARARPPSPLRAQRHFVGYDTDADYVALATQRVAEERDRLAGQATAGPVLPVVSSAAPPPDSDEGIRPVRCERAWPPRSSVAPC